MSALEVNGARITPGKIVCIGRNYVEHIRELNNEIPDEMVVFFKPGSCIGANLQSEHGEPLHFETELCFLIESGGLGAVAVGFDLTKRQLQSQLKQKGLPWERAKAFDGAAVFSEFVEFDDLSQLRFEMDIDGEPRQQGHPGLMMFKPEAMLEELQKSFRLDDADVLMTGTPKGVGEVPRGAEFRVRLFEADKLLLEQSWISN